MFLSGCQTYRDILSSQSKNIPVVICLAPICISIKIDFHRALNYSQTTLCENLAVLRYTFYFAYLSTDLFSSLSSEFFKCLILICGQNTLYRITNDWFKFWTQQNRIGNKNIFSLTSILWLILNNYSGKSNELCRLTESFRSYQSLISDRKLVPWWIDDK